MRAKESKTNEIQQRFLSIPEVQSFLGIKSRKTILKYISTGKLRAYKIGGTRWRIATEEVTAFLKREFKGLADAAPEQPAPASVESVEAES